jgi:Glycosyl transferase family 2
MVTVTVITATTGRTSLLRCAESVANQRLSKPGRIQHLLITDGPESGNLSASRLAAGITKHQFDLDVINLPYPVGKDRWNGHRMYAAGTFLAKGDWIMYLDDDNTLEPNHVETCLEAAETAKAYWSYSLRKIVDQEGNFLCNDDCESLGKYHTVLSPYDHLVDVNCYFLRRDLAVQLTPIWYRKAREPGVKEVDRALVQHLITSHTPGADTGLYTVKYAVGGNALSVAPDFFIQGNKKMNDIYKGNFPWRKK